MAETGRESLFKGSPFIEQETELLKKPKNTYDCRTTLDKIDEGMDTRR